MGVGKKQTVGYWYKMLLHFGICRAPVDGLLEMRVGDRVAWSGELSESGTLSISQPNLFGGESAEGGIDGSLDVMMGEADQVPNTYLVQQLGAEQSAYRGKVTAAWKGGRWGAMNPYPKPVAFKVRRASSEWYPSKAAIPLGGTALSGLEALTTIPVLDGVGGGGIFSGGAVYGPYYLDANPGVHGSVFLCMIYLHPNVPGAGPHTVYAELGGAQIWSKAITWLPGEAEKLIRVQLNVPVGHVGVRLGFHGSLTGNFYLHLRGIVDSTAWRSVVPDQGIVEADDPAFGIVTDGAGSFRYADAVWSLVHIWGVHDSYVSGAFFGMNPAHIIYDSIADPDMLGDPPGAINEASFSAAADVLYAEGFGLCTTYDATAESIDEFQKRICAVIGATCARDRRSGQWMLDLQRGGGDPDLLPVLGDDDILDYATEPGTLDDAVNQVVVKWFDPVQKEERSTAPVQALGLIQALGGPVSETAQYPEIPVESLALRAGARDLRNKATPLRRFELKTNRVPFGWRAGTYFRLQTPKRGIADMVCLLGEIDPGTLRQGAISIVAVQDVFSMPAAVYVTPQPAPPAGADEVTAAEHQRAIEAPYAELARALTADELGALSTDAGHLAVLAGQPAAAWNYELLTAATGEDLASRGIADWTPTCLAAAAAGFMDTSIAIVDATGLDELELPVAAAWDEEIVRVDAIDLVAGTIAIGRGCADTVPATHVAGSVLYFVGAAAGADGREYVDGETVSAKVLSRGLGGTLDADATPTLTCVMDSRAARPYPPAGLQISGVAYPSSVAGAITVTWAHRDRVQQADALLDTTDASVGPEAGTSYDCSAYDDDTNVLLAQSLGLTGTSWSVAVSGGRDLRIEVVSKRAGLESWQRQVRRFAHVDGLVLLENGDVLTMEQGQRGVQESAPPDTSGFAHRATVALTGTHSASERLVFNLLFSGSTSIINASAAGTTSLAEFASVIAAEFTLRGFFATAAGDSVHVHSTAAFLSLTAYSAWVRNPVAYTVQDAAAPSVGGWQWTFIDLYQSIAFVSTCPDNSAPLATSGLAQVAFDVHKRLRGAAPITGGHVFDGGGDSRRFYLSWYTSPWSTNYLTQLQGLVDAINANADLAANGITAGLSLMTPPPTPDHAMTRAAAVLTATGNYAVSVAFITPWNASPLPSAVHPSGYFLGIAQWADMGPAIPGGLPQISAFGPRPSAGYALAAGQQWWLSIDGAEYHYVLTGSETSGADVAAGLAALVDPGGDWTVTWESDEALVTATAVDAPFACSVWASYGVRVATNIDY